MTPHEVWFLLALALIVGGFGGSLIGNWWSERRCCECCTCENCAPPMIAPKLGRGYSVQFDESGQEIPGSYQEREGRRPLLMLEPGPTIYPELAALAEQAIDGPQIDAERPDTGTWLRTLRIRWESEYPIPGTPQWEARHPVGVS